MPNLKGKIKIDKRKKGTVQSNNTVRTKDYISYNLVFYQNDTRRLRDFIYQNDGISMVRKKQIFLDAGEIKNWAVMNPKK